MKHSLSRNFCGLRTSL